MDINSKKYQIDKKTIEAMVGRYCKVEHGSKMGELCDECASSLEYSLKRLEHCPHGEEKMACARCPIHCYRKSEKEKMIDVMRKTRVWMLFRHPILTYYHFK